MVKVFTIFFLSSTLFIGATTGVYAMDSRVKSSYSDWTYVKNNITDDYELYAWGYVESDFYHYTSCSCKYEGVTKTGSRIWGTGLVSNVSPSFDGLSYWDCFFASVEDHTYYGFQD
jgi:hypothetical protein